MRPITVTKAQKQLALYSRAQRIHLKLTQKSLSERSGVPLPTLRKFEQKGEISLESYIKIQIALDMIRKILRAAKPQLKTPISPSGHIVMAQSLDTILRKRGMRKSLAIQRDQPQAPDAV